MFGSIVREVGLPNGTTWSYAVDGVGAGLNASLSNLSLLGGRHTLEAYPVYFSNGTGFEARSIDIHPFFIFSIEMSVGYTRV